MKSIWVLLGIMNLTGAAPAADYCTAQVRLTNTAVVTTPALFQAKSAAAAMFAEVGVKLKFTSAFRPSTCRHQIEIRFESGDPGADRPDSLAYALPYLESGTGIHVFVQRIEAMVPAGRAGVLLGHVLTHEITHVLEGTSRHSDNGVMKAHGDAADLRAMETRPLPFAPLDVLLLQAAATRESSPAGSLAVAK